MENASTFAIPPAFSQKTVGIALEVWYNGLTDFGKDTELLAGGGNGRLRNKGAGERLG